MDVLLAIDDPDLDAAIQNGTTVSSEFSFQRVPSPACALQRLGREPCAMVLAGMKSVSNGSAEIFEQVRFQFPKVPIVVLTGGQPGDTIQDALQSQVAGCLPRQNIATDLARTVQALLRPISGEENSVRVCYTMENAPELLPLVVRQMRSLLQEWPFKDFHEPARLTVALSEALDNALYHGNLELDSALRQGDGSAWREESQRRRAIAPFRDRRIRFQASVSHDTATFTVADEGTGFDLSQLRDCTDPENLELCSGRGLMLMRRYMDEVRFNETGNEVTLVKHRPNGHAGTETNES